MPVKKERINVPKFRFDYLYRAQVTTKGCAFYQLNDIRFRYHLKLPVLGPLICILNSNIPLSRREVILPLFESQPKLPSRRFLCST